MDRRHTPPSLTRLWADEVLYLHSLWRQGPPPNPNPNANLRPINSTEFKKSNKKKKIKNQSQPSDPPAPQIEWPVNPSPDRDAEPAGWPDPARNPNTRPPPSAAEQARARAVWLQRTALKSCCDFFSNDESDDDEMSEDEEDKDKEELKAFEFFLRVFENNEELRSYYTKNHEKGEFFCLVCGGIGVKLGKKYGDCVGLVQHSRSISKTKKRGAHRGFGRAVCQVLGWDINLLPNIVFDRGEPLGQSLVKEAEMQEHLQKEDGIKEIIEIPDDDVHKDDSNEDLMDCIKAKKIGLSNEDLQKEDGIKEIVEIPNDNVHKDDSNEDLMDFIKAKEIGIPNKGVNDEKEELLSEIGKPLEGSNKKKKKYNKKKHLISSPSHPPAAEIVWPCKPRLDPKPDANGCATLIQAQATIQPRHPPAAEEQSDPAAAEIAWPCRPRMDPKLDANGWEALTQTQATTQPRQCPAAEEQSGVTAV